MGKTACITIGEYNSFCKNLTVGNILYNIDSTNLWGDFLLVVNKTKVTLENRTTYTLLLVGLKRENGVFIPRNLCISLSPDLAYNIPYLKYVGYCKFELLPVIHETEVSIALVATYGEIDLCKYSDRLNLRKPQKRKYGNDGKPIIKEFGN